MTTDTDLPYQPYTIQQQPLMKENSSSIWQVIFILLFVVDALCGYYLLGSWGYDSDLIKISFILLPIVNLLLLIGYNRLIAQSGYLRLLKFGCILLIVGNLTFGYNVYDQEHYGIGLGFLGFVPFLSVLAINDLTAVLFYIKTQHPQGIVKLICYAVLIPISLYFILFIYVIHSFLDLWGF